MVMCGIEKQQRERGETPLEGEKEEPGETVDCLSLGRLQINIC